MARVKTTKKVAPAVIPYNSESRKKIKKAPKKSKNSGGDEPKVRKQRRTVPKRKGSYSSNKKAISALTWITGRAKEIRGKYSVDWKKCISKASADYRDYKKRM